MPVRFSEINQITAIVELEYRSGSLLPELSFGTHFFQDLVEMDIFYAAIFSGKKKVGFNKAWLAPCRNLLWDLVPEDGRYEECVKVCDLKDGELVLKSDILSQKVICYRE